MNDRLPPSLLENPDPIEENPFSPEDPRHQVWAEATRKAHKSVYRFNEKVLEACTELDIASLGAKGHRAVTIDLARGKFGIWAERYLAVVRTDADLKKYDRWLVNYADSWITRMRQFTEQRQMESGVDHEVDTLTRELRISMATEVERWRSEARDWVDRCEVYQRSLAEDDDSAKAESVAPSDQTEPQHDIEAAVKPLPVPAAKHALVNETAVNHELLTPDPTVGVESDRRASAIIEKKKSKYGQSRREVLVSPAMKQWRKRAMETYCNRFDLTVRTWQGAYA